MIPGIKRALRNSQAWIHPSCVPAAGITGCLPPLFPSGGLEYDGRVRASRFYCHHDHPVVVFRELASHSLAGCVVSGVVCKFDSFMGGMGMEEFAGNVAVGKKREQELPLEVE